MLLSSRQFGFTIYYDCSSIVFNLINTAQLLFLVRGGGGGGGARFFFRWFWLKKIITNSYFIFFYVYMSKCRQFEGLSTGKFTWTIPNHTIKLQLHRPRHLIFKQKKKINKIVVYSAAYQGYLSLEEP